MKNKHGFTIVEMLIYMGILAVLTITLTRLFSGILNVQLESEATSAVESDSRFLYQRFSHDLGRATAITVPSEVGEVTNTLSILIGSDTHTYALSGGNFVLTNMNGTDVLNSYATQISNVTLRKLGSVNGKQAVQIRFTITSVTERPSGPESKNIQMTFTLR